MGRKKKIESAVEAVKVAVKVVKAMKPKKELPKNDILQHSKFAKFKGEK